MDQARRTLRKAIDAAQAVSITAAITGIIGGIVAFGQGISVAGLSLVAGSALAGATGFMLSCWARVWLFEKEPVEQPLD